MSSRQLKKITGYDETEALRNDILKICQHPENSGFFKGSDIFLTSKKVSLLGYFVSIRLPGAFRIEDINSSTMIRFS